jgi:hypothetical protein
MSAPAAVNTWSNAGLGTRLCVRLSGARQRGSSTSTTGASGARFYVLDMLICSLVADVDHAWFLAGKPALGGNSSGSTDARSGRNCATDHRGALLLPSAFALRENRIARLRSPGDLHTPTATRRPRSPSSATRQQPVPHLVQASAHPSLTTRPRRGHCPRRGSAGQHLDHYGASR